MRNETNSKSTSWAYHSPTNKPKRYRGIFQNVSVSFGPTIFHIVGQVLVFMPPKCAGQCFFLVGGHLEIFHLVNVWS